MPSRLGALILFATGLFFYTTRLSLLSERSLFCFFVLHAPLFYVTGGRCECARQFGLLRYFSWAISVSLLFRGVRFPPLPQSQAICESLQVSMVPIGTSVQVDSNFFIRRFSFFFAISERRRCLGQFLRSSGGFFLTLHIRRPSKIGQICNQDA